MLPNAITKAFQKHTRKKPSTRKHNIIFPIVVSPRTTTNKSLLVIFEVPSLSHSLPPESQAYTKKVSRILINIKNKRHRIQSWFRTGIVRDCGSFQCPFVTNLGLQNRSTIDFKSTADAFLLPRHFPDSFQTTSAPFWDRLGTKAVDLSLSSYGFDRRF